MLQTQHWVFLQPVRNAAACWAISPARRWRGEDLSAGWDNLSFHHKEMVYMKTKVTFCLAFSC